MSAFDKAATDKEIPGVMTLALGNNKILSRVWSMKSAQETEMCCKDAPSAEAIREVPNFNCLSKILSAVWLRDWNGEAALISHMRTLSSNLIYLSLLA